MLSNRSRNADFERTLKESLTALHMFPVSTSWTEWRVHRAVPAWSASGYFEADEYRAVLDNLPEYLRPVIQTAYITGWRINSDILTRQKCHVTSDSGCLWLESSGANDENGRSFPLTTERIHQTEPTASAAPSTKPGSSKSIPSAAECRRAI
jgi:hypothetical protein